MSSIYIAMDQNVILLEANLVQFVQRLMILFLTEQEIGGGSVESIRLMLSRMFKALGLTDEVTIKVQLCEFC